MKIIKHIHICDLYTVKEILNVKGFLYFHTLNKHNTNVNCYFCKATGYMASCLHTSILRFLLPHFFCAVYAKMITMAALRCTCKLKSVKDFAIHDAHLSGRERERVRETHGERENRERERDIE